MHDISPAPEVYIHPIYQNDEQLTKRPVPYIQAGAIASGILVITGLVFFFSSAVPKQPESAIEISTAEITAPLKPAVETKRAVQKPSDLPGKQTDQLANHIEMVTPAEKTPHNDTIDTSNHVEDGKWLEHKISSGDSLSGIFSKIGLGPELLYGIVKGDALGEKLADILPGQKLKVKFDPQGGFQQLVWEQSRIHSMVVTRAEKGFDYSQRTQPLEIRNNHAKVVINNSLFLDGQKAGLSDQLIMNLAAIFGWDIDFALGIRKGDQFSLIYEEKYLKDGSKYDDGNILAAEFVNQGRHYRAIRYQDPTGYVDYFTPSGKSMRKAFLRTPVKFSRISSGFTLKRWHPVLKKWRSHRGVDYAAPTGTPIKATGNGKIVFSGMKGGYGRAIFVKHGSKYTTVYGHLSKFSKRAKVGNRVEQGDIIGYVGQSGLATGPHLHYEMRINGVYRNPLTVKLPSAKPIPAKYYLAFSDHANELIAQLAMISNDMLAQHTKDKKAIHQ